MENEMINWTIEEYKRASYKNKQLYRKWQEKVRDEDKKVLRSQVNKIRIFKWKKNDLEDYHKRTSAYMRKYQENHKEECNAKAKAYYYIHRDEILLKAKEKRR